MERRNSAKEKRKRNKGFPYKTRRKMDKKAQAFFLTFMLGVTIIVLALAFAPGLSSHLVEMRNSDNMDCGNSSISTVDKTTCVVADISGFYIIGGLIAIAGTVIGARLISR